MTKKTLIILPGWGGSHKTWHDFIEEAQKEYNVYCIDLPCFGTTSCPETIWGVEEYARFVESKVKSQKSKVILLGHSFGGQIAVYVAAHYPELIERLILVGAAVCRPPQPVRRFLFGSIAKIGKFIFCLPMIEKGSVWAKALLYRVARSPDYARTSGVKREIFQRIIRQDLTYLLPRVTIKTLVVWGAKDTYTPLWQGKKIAAVLPRATLRIISHGRHGLHLHHIDELLTTIRTFLQET